ncbi:hypothetical protein MRS44_010592 [Fusarium solani]|uniref:uncharacterized protein n=1 Tax=Fusarium solani TaxID=169388 RepID=UPI0032C431FA|nr:hypothetical protein MRS44_010592 [Fusarium solani]
MLAPVPASSFASCPPRTLHLVRPEGRIARATSVHLDRSRARSAARIALSSRLSIRQSSHCACECAPSVFSHSNPLSASPVDLQQDPSRLVPVDCCATTQASSAHLDHRASAVLNRPSLLYFFFFYFFSLSRSLDFKVLDFIISTQAHHGTSLQPSSATARHRLPAINQLTTKAATPAAPYTSKYTPTSARHIMGC